MSVDLKARILAGSERGDGSSCWMWSGYRWYLGYFKTVDEARVTARAFKDMCLDSDAERRKERYGPRG